MLSGVYSAVYSAFGTCVFWILNVLPGENGFLPVLEDDFLAWYSVKSFWVYTCQGNTLELRIV